jgi:UDP-GlcNAc:undecaprenyl-phosphate GlcNAc-1-phosphate transferase
MFDGEYASAGLFAAVLALVSAGFVRWMMRVGALDHPGHRSSHDRPTPKGGGVGILAALLLGCVTGAVCVQGDAAALLGLAMAALLLGGVSYADDVLDLPFAAKLAAQIGAAVIVLATGARFGRILALPGWQAGLGGAALPLSVLWVVFLTNTVNFMDGLNGLAAGSCGIAALVAAALTGERWPGVGLPALALASGLAGFLPFNYPRARIFMGDVGSQVCGLALAWLTLRCSQLPGPQPWVLLVPMLLAGMLFDVVFTLARRACHGQRLTEAHRGHLYQVAARSGVPATVVTLVHWTMTGLGGLAYVALLHTPVAGGWSALALVATPQIAWLATVLALARRAGLKSW